MGPDNICGKLLKVCAWQLATPFSSLFQKSLDQHTVPKCWKSAVIFERIVLQHLFSSVLKDIDVMQFAYQPKNV